MNYFLTSDQHHQHGKIIGYSNRPFKVVCAAGHDYDGKPPAVACPTGMYDNDCKNCGALSKVRQTEGLIEKWNAVVKQDDVVINLGDYIWTKDPGVWASITERLNGRQRIIVGNHDHLLTDKFANVKPIHQLPFEIANLIGNGKVEWIKNYHEEKINKRHFIFFHFPLGSWHKAMYGSIVCHGHTHRTYPRSWPLSHDDGANIECGVDAHNYTPVSLEKVIEIANLCSNGRAHKFENG